MTQSHNIVPTHQTNTAVRDSSRHQGEGSTEGGDGRGGGLMVEAVNKSSASSRRPGTKESTGDGCDERVTWVGWVKQASMSSGIVGFCTRGHQQGPSSHCPLHRSRLLSPPADPRGRGAHCTPPRAGACFPVTPQHGTNN
jgi:hypothetical protein